MKFKKKLKKTKIIILSLVTVFILSQCTLNRKLEKGYHKDAGECKVGDILKINTHPQKTDSSTSCSYKNDALKLEFFISLSNIAPKFKGLEFPITAVEINGTSNGEGFIQYFTVIKPTKSIAIVIKRKGKNVFLDEPIKGEEEIEGLILKLKDKSWLLGLHAYEIQSLPK